MLCNIKPVPFHESDKHIFAKIPGGVRTHRSPPLDPPMYIYLSCHFEVIKSYRPVLASFPFLLFYLEVPVRSLCVTVHKCLLRIKGQYFYHRAKRIPPNSFVDFIQEEAMRSGRSDLP